MNSAIRVFNNAVVADDAGGMVSEKVRGLILVAIIYHTVSYW